MCGIQKILSTILKGIFTVFQIIYWYLEAFFRLFISPPMKSIDGEIILVTGATGGIGKEICRHLIQCSDNLTIILWDLNLGDLENLAHELQEKNSGVKAFPFVVDISSRKEIEEGCKLVSKTTTTLFKCFI